MLDIGWGEMLILALMALVVLGPRELPGFLRMLGGLWQRLRIQLFTLRQNFSLMDLPADWQPQSMDPMPDETSDAPRATAPSRRRKPSPHGAPGQKR